jgi:hypothetical protein
MTTETPIFSKRAQKLLTEKAFAQTDVRALIFQWKIEYNCGPQHFQTDKILTLQYSNPVNDDLTTVLLESVCKLSQGKMLQFLFQLSFREVENFLRDENHIPSFGAELETRGNEVFISVKNALLAEILLTKMNELDFSFDLSSWKKLSLPMKNKLVMEVFSGLLTLFPKEKKLELILAEGDTVTVKKNDFPLELAVLETLLNRLAFEKETDSPLKVIGTL